MTSSCAIYVLSAVLSHALHSEQEQFSKASSSYRQLLLLSRFFLRRPAAPLRPRRCGARNLAPTNVRVAVLCRRACVSARVRLSV
eukprot:3627613-Pleurochrysis_carterae.AAC.5